MTTTTISIKDIDLDFLPLIYDIVRCIEKEVNDNLTNPKQANRDQNENRKQNDCHEKIIELKKKIQKSRDLINKVNGISLTKEDQIKKYESLNKQLSMKKELLLRYKNNCPIDTNPKN